MEKMKESLCIFFAVALVMLAGCTADSNAPENQVRTETTIGRYVESEITPPEVLEWSGGKAPYTLGVYPDINGALYYLATVSGETEAAREEVIYCRSLDCGQTWETLSTKWYDALYEQYGLPNRSLLNCAAFGGDGTLYCFLIVENNWYKIVKVKGDEIEELPTEGWDHQDFYDALQGFFAQSFTVLPNNDIVVSFDVLDQYSFVYDGSSGKLKKKIETKNATVFFGKDRYAKLCFDSARQRNALISFDYNDAEKSNYPVNTAISEEVHLADGAGHLYMIDDTGVYDFPDDAQESNYIMDPKFYTFGSPSWYAKQFTYDVSSKAFYMILKDNDSGRERLFKYTFDASIPSQATESLTIFTLRDNDTLRQAISVYQRKHPEQKVELEIGLLENSGVTKDDAIRILNTELLAKKGPDVIILDGLPIQSYIEKGILADLSDLAKSDSLFHNLAQAYASGSKVYAIPARCSIPVMCGEKTFVDSLTDLPRIVEQAQKCPPLPKQIPLSRTDRLEKGKRPLAFVNAYWDTVKLFYNTYSGKLVNEEKTVDKAVLSELLNNSKALFQQYNILKGDDFLGDGLTGEILSFSAGDVYGQHTLLGITSLRDFNDCFRYSRYAPQTDPDKLQSTEFYFVPLCGPEKNVFIPSCIASINISSQKIERAKQFIETLLDEEVQTPAYSDGFPINKASFKSGYAESRTCWSIKYKNDMEQLASSLTTPVNIDETILGTILDEVKPYYDDEETLDEAINNICAKLRTYLAEKS